MIGLAITAGLPAAVPASIWPNPLVNMNDWYCSTASSSQTAARASCSTRLVSGGCHAPSAALLSLPRLAACPPATAMSLIPVLLGFLTRAAPAAACVPYS